ncbi:MAG: hypothetical protein PHQ12_01815 [Chthoniobacteraceae bacterium]|nr:hypothetical protein [Chthoniobacteraceae bacterium]
MKRTFLLLAVAGLSAMEPGCATTCRQRTAISCESTYSRVVIADFEGHWISEYIAEGPVSETCHGVCFRAVQRRIFKPVPLTFRYPLGRPVKTQGSNVIVTPAARPPWLP